MIIYFTLYTRGTREDTFIFFFFIIFFFFSFFFFFLHRRRALGSALRWIARGGRAARGRPGGPEDDRSLVVAGGSRERDERRRGSSERQRGVSDAGRSREGDAVGGLDGRIGVLSRGVKFGEAR